MGWLRASVCRASIALLCGMIEPAGAGNMVGCGGNIQGMQGTDAGAGTVTNQHCQCTTHAPRPWSGHAAMACVWAWAGWSGRPVVRPGRVQRIMCSQGGGGTPGGRPGFATPLCREGGKRRISQIVGCAGYAEGTEEMVGRPVQWVCTCMCMARWCTAMQLGASGGWPVSCRCSVCFRWAVHALSLFSKGLKLPAHHAAASCRWVESIAARLHWGWGWGRMRSYLPV